MRILVTMFLLTFALSITGCATTATKTVSYTDSMSDPDIDWEYVSEVNQQAARSGVKVHWLSMPHKKHRPSTG